jgi:DNA helicase-2/ATP-dependent DNA helicase PcrA
MNMKHLFDTLNPQQYAAVTQPPVGAVLVQAGAGTGKTRVLTMRIAYLIEQEQEQTTPSTILALTFTNKAAKELRERLRDLLGHRSRGLTSGTFHAICTRMLREDIAGRIGSYTADFTIYAEDEQVQVAAEALDAAMERPPAQMEPIDLLRHISRAKSRLLTPRLLLRFSGSSPLHSFVAGCYRRYQRTLERSNALDFDDLIFLAHRLLTEHPDVLEKYQERWHHILVDEYQDTDRAQLDLLKVLYRARMGSGQGGGGGEGRGRSLFVVGDGMQSIYGFRNADHTIIASFQQGDFPDARVCNLTTNYRSRQPILDAAYAVIRHSTSVATMALHSASASTIRDIGSCVRIIDAKNGRDEAEHIARCIGELANERRPLNTIAILYRTRHMSRPIETALRHARLPYRVRGSTGFYDRAVVRDLLAYLRAIANPADNLSLTRAATRPARGLGGQALATFATFASQHGLSLLEALSHPQARAQVSSRAARGAQSLADLVGRWQRLVARGYPPAHLLSDVLEQSGYLAALAEKLPPEEFLDAQSHLQELVEAAQEHTTLSGFLQEIALMTNLDRDDEERACVELMTIHSAKGLEWPVVFVVGMEEGTLPHERSLTTREGMEEERRLCYVAMTRAGEHLYLSWAAGRSRGKTAQTSRFLREIEAYGRERKT